MGTNTLGTRANGQTIDQTWFNDFNTALGGDFVGRDASTFAPAAGKALGTITYPWGVARVGSLVVDGSLIDFAGLTGDRYKIVSGAKRSTSNQPLFIDPAGSGGGASATVLATTTPLVIEAAGEQGTFSADVTVSSLSTAPSSNNTCLVDESGLGGYDSRSIGESWRAGRDLVVDTMGSEITALVGKWAAFKVGSTEYFMAYVESTTSLRNCRRGFFYNSTGVPSKRLVLANNDTITLLKATWLFADTNGSTVDKTTTTPVFDATEPGSPATGDYWYDLVNKLWKRYNGSAFVTVSRVLIGVVACDSSDCVAARSFDFSAAFSDFNGIDLERRSNSVINGTDNMCAISVMGNLVVFGTHRPTWDMSTDLAGSDDLYTGTEQASTPYYMYIKDTGQEVISDWAPYPRGDLKGWYHPHNPWRCVGFIWNDGSSNFVSQAPYVYRQSIAPPKRDQRSVRSANASGTSTSGSYADVASMSGTISTNGREVVAKIITNANQGTVSYLRTTGAAGSAFLKLVRDSTDLQETEWMSTANEVRIPANIEWRDRGIENKPGVYAYKVQFKTTAGSFVVNDCILVLQEATDE